MARFDEGPGSRCVSYDRKRGIAMFDRFTDRARKCMGLARQEAQRLDHDYIGTEHMLLGILASGGVAVRALEALHVGPKELQQEVESFVVRGTATPTMGQLPFTPSAKKALELSL